MDSIQKFPCMLTKETGGEIVEFLEKVEQSGKWPQQACTTMFFLIPQNVTSERPIALMPMMIRWWKALRAPEVVGEGSNCRQEKKIGSCGLGPTPGEGFRAVSLLVVWAWATHFNFPRKLLRMLLLTVTATLPGSNWSCLLSAYCVAGRTE